MLAQRDKPFLKADEEQSKLTEDDDRICNPLIIPLLPLLAGWFPSKVRIENAELAQRREWFFGGRDKRGRRSDRKSGIVDNANLFESLRKAIGNGVVL